MKHVILVSKKISLSGLLFAILFMMVSCNAFQITTQTSAQTPSSTTFQSSETITLPSLSHIVAKVLPSVVFILVDTTDPSTGEFVQAAGSGVIFSSEGYILTNKHVVNNFRKIAVTLSDRHVYSVDLGNVWMDDVTDLAVIKIDETNLPTLQFGNPADIRVGDWVVAVGNSLGLSPSEGGASVTEGIVSNLNRSFSIDTTNYYGVLQTSAAINPGNSGGPLVNLSGDVIGINTASAEGAENVSFALTVPLVQHVYQDLVEFGKPQHPFLGVNLGDVTMAMAQNPNNPPRGATVLDVVPGSPAENAGLRSGDIITEFDGKSVNFAADVIYDIWGLHSPDDTVDIVYLRGGIEMKASITMPLRPQGSEAV